MKKERRELTPEERALLLKAFGNIALILTVKWAIILGINKYARHLREQG